MRAVVSMKTLMESARRIASKEIDVESWVGPQQILPILNNVKRGCRQAAEAVGITDWHSDLGVS